MIRSTLALLVILGGVLVAHGKPVQPVDEKVAKLITQLDSANVRVREEATRELQQLGAPILPALRKAAAAPKIGLEAQRRVETVIERIETDLLAAEEKVWKGLDAPKRDIKERLARIVARTPSLSEAQLASVIYLLTSNNKPTNKEFADVQQRLKEHNLRLLPTLQLARTLVQSERFNADLAAGNARILNVQRGFKPGENLTESLLRLNTPETMKAIEETTAAMSKAVKDDEEFCQVAFLVVLSRFPDKKEMNFGANHLKKIPRTGRVDVIWALVNTKEFIQAAR